jgi:hypothetical protein
MNSTREESKVPPEEYVPTLDAGDSCHNTRVHESVQKIDGFFCDDVYFWFKNQ